MGMRCQVLTGDEPMYDEDEYRPTRHCRNCYAHAVNSKSPTPAGVKATPGLRAGIQRPLDLKSCADTQARALADNPGKMYVAEPCKPCRAGFYRAMLMLDKHGGDFHWTRSHGALKHRVKRGDTYKTLAGFYGVPARQIWSDNGHRRLRVGDALVLRVSFYSHKPGLTATKVTDSCGRFLTDPRRAAREGCMRSGPLSYEVMCNDLCVKEGGLPTQ